MPRNPGSLRVTMLGTGTSTGVPLIGCRCRVCTSADFRDRRLRSACYVRAGDIGIVIDTGPDFRQQMLREGIHKIDAVLYTHHHADHIVGIDDLRPYFFGHRAEMPCYAHPVTAATLRRMFPYIFERDGSYPAAPKLCLHEIDQVFQVQSRYDACQCVQVIPIEVHHGQMTQVYGYRIGDFAYVTDASHIPDAALASFRGLEVLVLNALRHEPHPMHFTIREAVALARHIGARQTYLTHITHTVLHAEEDRLLPKGIALAYDGLTFDVV